MYLSTLSGPVIPQAFSEGKRIAIIMADKRRIGHLHMCKDGELNMRYTVMLDVAGWMRGDTG